MNNVNIEVFLEKINRWAKEQYDIKALLLVGSYARGNPCADSDIDLILMTNQSDKYLTDYTFTEKFGKTDKIEKEYWGRVTSLRIWYHDSYELELGITTPDWITERPLDPGTLQVIGNGAKVILDRIDNLSDLILSVKRENIVT